MDSLIPSAVDWLRRGTTAQTQWLLLGKGPSFSCHTRHDLRHYRTLALNHACLPALVDAAHFIDLESMLDCAPLLLDRNTVVIGAWRPHQKCRPGKEDLFDICRRHSVLRQLRAQQRLFAYHASTANDQQPNLPRIAVKYFSAEAGLGLLAKAGAREILTLGIDGGSRYSEEFDERHRLANGRRSFDIQFREMDAFCRRQGIHYRPLRDIDP